MTKTETPTIHVTLEWLRSDMTGHRTRYYSCVGPDGTKFTNSSITTLRDVLKRKYGKIETRVTDLR